MMHCRPPLALALFFLLAGASLTARAAPQGGGPTVDTTNTGAGTTDGLGGNRVLTFPASPALAIPDNNIVSTISTINILTSMTITSVSVNVVITHSHRGDLEVSLIGPDYTTVLLHNQTGGSADNLKTVYADLTAPTQTLAAFTGKTINGAWKLRVRDLEGADVGKLSFWEIDFRTN